MKIAFDGQLFLKGNKTGIAWCAHNLILELAKYPENECVIQCFSKGYSKEQLQNLRVYEDAGCKVEYCRWFPNVLYRLLWNFIPIPYRIFFGENVDITQFFNFVVPPGVQGRKITIIHDMGYKAYPETVNRKTRNWLRLSLKKSCRHADHIITDSEFSKKEIIKYLRVNSQKITVVPCAVNHEEFRTDYSVEKIEEVKNKYHIDEKYFLYLGTIEPRKNLERLIKAYAELVNRRQNVPQLVLAGGKGWYYDSIFQMVDTYHLKEKVIFTGYVEQKDSPLLMSGAIAFVFPSLYEGFGMPPLEAMACGTPVITSKTTSLPEVVGDAGILIDPEDIEELSDAMEQMMDNEELREKLKKAGQKRAEKFTWKKSAEILMGVYRSALGENCN